MFGTSANNTLVGTAGNDSIYGLDGADTLWGGFGNDVLYGGSGNDLLADEDSGYDTLCGDEGDDYLQTRDLISDHLYGGSGFDTAYVDRSSNAARFSGVFTAGSAQDQRLSDGTVLNSIERLYLYLGPGNDSITVNLSPSTVRDGGSQVGFGAGTDLLTINFVQFTTAITMTFLPFTPGNNFRFLTGGEEIFSALSVERFSIQGSAAGDIFEGGTLSDTLSGNGGHDVLAGAGGNDRLFGGAGDDIMQGGEGADSLGGGDGNDVIYGDASNDTLVGGRGNDTLNGGSGADTFVFDLRASRANVDLIEDFNVIEDVIRLKSFAFPGLRPGVLDSAAFAANTSGTATGTDNRIIYETDTGRLYFDLDGSGPSARILFANLDPNLDLNNADFIIF